MKAPVFKHNRLLLPLIIPVSVYRDWMEDIRRYCVMGFLCMLVFRRTEFDAGGATGSETDRSDQRFFLYFIWRRSNCRLVNLVSKTPNAKRELSFLANGTSAGGIDLSSFYSQKFNKIGVTVFGSANSGKAFDPAHIGLTAIPEFERYTINPRLFLYGEKTTANIGISYITEKRIGGSLDYIRKGTAGYFEKNNTDRFTTQAQVTHQLNDHSQLNFKTSYSLFDRLIQVPAYTFQGMRSILLFSEATYSSHMRKHNG
jgi:hypothetical protein